MDWQARTLIVDNHDSFTWNLVQMLETAGDDPIVIRADDDRLTELGRVPPRRLIISPGPGSPSTAPAAIEAIKMTLGRAPILGVCLGHQCLGSLFGGKVEESLLPVHGKTAEIDHTGTGLFVGIPSPMIAMRYHSLTLPVGSITSPLQETAWSHKDEETIVMAVEHEELPVAGVQFHPESFLTINGERILENFLSWK